jgi:hypothetical protein
METVQINDGPDLRLDFMGSFIQKTLKLKPEKWQRLLTFEEHKTVIKDFLDLPCHMVLVIQFTASAQLLPVTTFPLTQLKSKGELRSFLFLDSIFTHDPFQAFISSSVFRSKFRATIVLRLSSQAILRRAPSINCRVLLMKFLFRFYRTPRTTTDGQKCKGLFINYVNHLGGEGVKSLCGL